jgi:hypothetical protein
MFRLCILFVWFEFYGWRLARAQRILVFILCSVQFASLFVWFFIYFAINFNWHFYQRLANKQTIATTATCKQTEIDKENKQDGIAEQDKIPTSAICKWTEIPTTATCKLTCIIKKTNKMESQQYHQHPMHHKYIDLIKSKTTELVSINKQQDDIPTTATCKRTEINKEQMKLKHTKIVGDMKNKMSTLKQTQRCQKHNEAVTEIKSKLET